jgi:tRNA pseudouridine55 synthase
MPILSGILNINKPQGLTSHDVVARIRKLSGQRKVGHTGTLDPMATGVLLVCLGQATRLIEYLQHGSKRYQATLRFGISTDTLDAEGQIIAQSDPSALTETQLRQILPAFQGNIEQIPPLFSALKREGQPLYKLARVGQKVEVKPRPVTIESLSWLDWQPPDLTLEVVCSPGTYIRALARDIGERAGTGAHLSALTRTANSGWSITQAVTLGELEQKPTSWQTYLYPLDQAIIHLPKVTLTAAAVQRVQQGQPIIDPISPVAGDLLRAYTPDGTFLAILTRVSSDDKLWQPKKVFHAGGT